MTKVKVTVLQHMKTVTDYCRKQLKRQTKPPESVLEELFAYGATKVKPLGACCTDRLHMEQQRLNPEEACCTDRWHIEQQRLNTKRACCTDRWHTEQQKLNTKRACCTDRWHMQQQCLNTDSACTKYQCPECWRECTYFEHSLLDHPVECIKPVVSHNNDVVKITQMTGGIINIYNHPKTKNGKSCDRVKSNNNQETGEKCLKEHRKTKKWKKNPFRVFFSWCRKNRVPSVSPERPRKPVQTIDEAVQDTIDVDTNLKDRQDVHVDRVHTSANVHADSEIRRAYQPEGGQLTQCHSSHISSTPKTLEYTARCRKESRLNFNKRTAEGKRNIESPSEQRTRERKEIEKSFEDQSDVFSIRQSHDPLTLQENKINIQKLKTGDCKVFEPTSNEHTSSFNQLQNETSKEFQTQIKRHKRVSPISSVYCEKNLLFDDEGESVFDDENDNDDLLRDHGEYTDRKQTPCNYDRRCELDTELGILKPTDPYYIQDETEAKASVTVRATSTQSSASEQMPSSGYPWDTNSNYIDGLSKDICNSSDFTKYAERSLETTNCCTVDVLKGPIQIRQDQSCRVTDIDTENNKKSDIILVVDATNEENSCSYYSGKEDQSSRISDGEDGAVSNQKCCSHKSIDVVDLSRSELNSSLRDRNTSLDSFNSNSHRLSDSKELNDATNEENLCSYDSGKEDQSSSISDGEDGAVGNRNCGYDNSIDLIDLKSSESNYTLRDRNTSLDPVSFFLHSQSDNKKLNEKVTLSCTAGFANTKSLNFTTTLQTCTRKEETPTSLLHRRYIKEEINMSVSDENVKTGNPQAVNIITESQNRESSVPSVQSEKTSDFQSAPFIDKKKKERKRHKSVNSDSGYESSKIEQQKQIVYRRAPESSENCIHEKQINVETDGSIRFDLLTPKTKIPKDNVCTTEMLSTSQSKGQELSAGCGNHFAQDFQFKNKNVWFINSFPCTPLIAICLDESNFSVIKVSDEGMLQEMEYVLNEDYHNEDCFQPERSRIESKDHYYANTARFKDTNDKNDKDYCGNYDEDDDVPQREMTDLDKESCTRNVQHLNDVITKKSRKKDFSDTVCDVPPCKLGTTNDLCGSLNISTYCARDNTGNNVSPSSKLQDTMTRKEKKCNEKQTIHDNNHHKRQNHNATRNNLESRDALFPSYKRLPSGKYVNNRDTQKYVDDSSKPCESTKTNKMKRRKCHNRCRKKVPKPEITSAFFQESMNQTSSVFQSGSSKIKRKKNKKSYLKRSWQKDGRLFGWQLTDSGIGTSDYSENSSAQQLKEMEKSSYLIKFKTGNLTKGVGSCKILPYLVKKKSDFQQLRKLIRKFITENRRAFVKNIVRELYIAPRRTEKVYGLDTYFNDVFNGNRFTEQSRLHYEWLRLESFRNYAGNGSALVLARNGFIHDHNEGPQATRCYLCNARNSNWEMFDDVREEHRRQSPNCPFNSNSSQVSQNIPITDNSEVSPRTSTNGSPPTASNNIAFTSARPADSNLTETSEAGATCAFQRLKISGDLSTGSESILTQPTEDRESSDRSLLALPRPRPQKALGRPGQSYSTILAPKRNNVATGARSNVGFDPTEGSTTAPAASNSNRIPSNQSQSVFTGPVAAGAFTGLSTRAQIPVSSATGALQGSSAPSTTSTTEGSGPGPGTGREADLSFTVVVHNPKHSEYQNTESRINSYQGWPDYLDQTPVQMAEAGFFFMGVADFTRCFCCGGGLRNWEPGDDPMLEHTRWFPRCEYVNKLKGERYVAAVQRRHQEHMAEQQRQQVELAQRRDEHRDPPDPVTTDVAEVLLEMGYSAERTREAILAVRQQRGSPVVTTQQVLTWLLDDEERRLNADTAFTETSTGTSTANTTAAAAAPSVRQIGSSNTAENTSETRNEQSEDNETGTVTDPVNNSNISPGKRTEQKQSAASTSTGQQTGTAAKPGSSSGESDESKSTANGNTSNSGTTIRETKKKKTRKKAKGKGSGKASSAAGELDAKSLKAENEKLREMQTCKICMEQPVNTTLLPCGHLVCCGSCAPRLQRCPICRKIIKGTVKTFMS